MILAIAIFVSLILGGGILLAWILRELTHAPEGLEDSESFHLDE